MDFFGILPALAANGDLRSRSVRLARTCPMPAKVLEGGDRQVAFRRILEDLISGQLTLSAAATRTEDELPRRASVHANSHLVFPLGWGERLVRTQLSRVYNQAILEAILESGQTRCYVPHSPHEAPGSPCTRLLAGRTHDARSLHDRLFRTDAEGLKEPGVKIPDHPHCTHVICPVSELQQMGAP